MPGLLDSVMEDLTKPAFIAITELIKHNNEKPSADLNYCLNCIFQIQYIVIKVRGFKIVLEFYPSGVEIFELIINYFLALDKKDPSVTHAVYVICLWIAVLGLAPFDLDTIDSKGGLIESLVNSLKEIVFFSGSIREVVCFSLSKVLNRKDLVSKGYLKDFIEWGIVSFQSNNEDLFMIVGVFNSFFELFKNGSASDLLPFAEKIFANVMNFQLAKHLNNSGIIRKYKAKILQRIGIMMLKPQDQGWKYNSKNNTATEIEIDYLFESEFVLLESIIDFLLEGLQDKEYIVRWSCAKGLGRICERLTKSMVEDILEAIFGKFDSYSDNSFHGGCMALGELCKREMILPKELERIVSVLEKALIFESNLNGTFSSGGLVRDAGCCIVWSIARAYKVEEMRPFIGRLSKKLILTILFDKEVNCRRAASAAFQECVGRQGSFPHGIEILTEADYFTLGNKGYCFLNIASFICQYEEYYAEIIDYLVENRLKHTDGTVRQMAAECLGIVACFQPEISSAKIPNLLKNCLSLQLDVRQGSLVGLGYLLTGLAGKNDFDRKALRIRKKMFATMTEKEREILQDSEYRQKFDEYFEGLRFKDNSEFFSKYLGEIEVLFRKIEGEDLFKGKGNEVMRRALNKFVRLLRVANVPLSEDTEVYFYEKLVDNFRHRNILIQIDTMTPFIELNKEIKPSEQINKLVDEMIEQINSDPMMFIPRGFALAISAVSKDILATKHKPILQALKNKLSAVDSDTRKHAYESILNITQRVIKGEIVHETLVEEAFEIYLNGLKDYEIDPKLGDVGSKCREVSIFSLIEIIILLTDKKDFATVEKHIMTVLKAVLKQSAEKMNKIRLVCGESMQKLVLHFEKNNLGHLMPQWELLKKVYLADLRFNEVEEICNVEWLMPEYGFSAIKPLFSADEFRFELINGAVVSIGGLTEDVQRCSLKMFNKYVEENKSDKLITELLQIFKRIFKENEKVDKVSHPLIVTLSFLFSKEEYLDKQHSEVLLEIGTCIVKENNKSKNVSKVLAAIDVFYSMLFVERTGKIDLYPRVMKRVLLLLAHKYPVIRNKAAEKLFVFLSSIMDDPEAFGLDFDQLDELMMVLGDIDWAAELEEVKQKRAEIAEMIKVPIN